ncbi:hypothetical protein SPRG_01778 [Saprolegnia parasitica CBS 223.65]|uniref:RING finger and CHY zinc finger domain-containing protein 1 n=1 Tax=Saprolegnia parasitica (strain CBS 223.65) TaxID=695850 RepID=A0A067CTR0_SAPPC|nr:hypothetical protein SPRG_01778 [Saprolegnia parasitica CBS 223.65]KDO33898.1 hypothetical protein SPRG_01778 [Saprolegnia parasitica CBS 223.65]|eukprot:XP_012195534.1 hypothetical protein SPRG_01778 [Saprolegnia parasitica CBS 223.65]
MSCDHYKRGCHLFAECCNQWFPCRVCHNEAQDGHEMDRHAVTRVRCRKCFTEQPPQQTCSKCSFVLGKYFCSVCNLFDDEGDEKGIFHCNDCGICRVGGRDKFFHCMTCGGCYAQDRRDKHVCINQAMRQECCICYESLFEARESPSVLPCGHVLHGACYDEMTKYQYGQITFCPQTHMPCSIACPLCRKSLLSERAQRRLERLMRREAAADGSEAGNEGGEDDGSSHEGPVVVFADDDGDDVFSASDVDDSDISDSEMSDVDDGESSHSIEDVQAPTDGTQ